MEIVRRAPRALPPPERDPRLAKLEEWFMRHGVPQFVQGYSARDRLHFLILPLVVLVAFEIGAAPWFARSVTPLLIVPPVVVALLVWAGPLAWTLLQGIRYPDFSWWQLGQLLFGFLIIGIPLGRSGWPPLWSDPWVDFTVILLAEVASIMLFARPVWSYKTTPLLWLTALIVGAVTLFAAIFAIEEIRGSYFLRRNTPGGLPALIFMIVILALLVLGIRAGKEPASDTRFARLSGRLFPAIPLLVLLLAAEATILREVTDWGWTRVWFPIGSIVVLLAISTVLSRDRASADTPVTELDTWACLKEGAANPWLLAVLLMASLIGYPMLVGRYIELDIFGRSVWGALKPVPLHSEYTSFTLLLLGHPSGSDLIASLYG